MELTVKQEDKFKIVELAGRIDWDNAHDLDNTVQQIIEEGVANIVFDLNQVKFICSGGIGTLVYNLNRVRQMGGDIYLIADNEYVTFIFDTLKFDIIFDGRIFKSIDEFREKHVLTDNN